MIPSFSLFSHYWRHAVTDDCATHFGHNRMTSHGKRSALVAWREIFDSLELLVNIRPACAARRPPKQKQLCFIFFLDWINQSIQNTMFCAVHIHDCEQQQLGPHYGRWKTHKTAIV
jgi:hypothetical protein